MHPDLGVFSMQPLDTTEGDPNPDCLPTVGVLLDPITSTWVPHSFRVSSVEATGRPLCARSWGPGISPSCEPRGMLARCSGSGGKGLCLRHLGSGQRRGAVEVPAESQEAVIPVAHPPDLHLGFHELSFPET